MTEITLSTGEAVLLITAPVKKFKGTRLPGADLLQAIQEAYSISIHEFSHRLFRFSFRTMQWNKPTTITIRESSKYLRLETVLTGELLIREPGGVELKLLAGQYRITDSKVIQSKFAQGQGCQYFAAFISHELLTQTSLGDTIIPGAPLMMTLPMREIIYRILDNPFEEKLRDAFYDYSMRELLFHHVSAPPFTWPGELTPAELAAVYAADQIIAADLSMHYSIQKLAKMVGTNMHVLKTGFARVFGMGPFERLLQRKMDRAKYLLEATDKQVQDIAELAGYETVTGFINAFRKYFKKTPKDWRKKSRGLL
ncbi:MAG: AraC family transcriptional regulator [Chitinophagaceae bacterium]